MVIRNSQSSIIIAISLVFLAVITALGIFKIPLNFLVIGIIALSVFLIAFLNTDIALGILIFSMLLSPELKIAQVPARAVVVRLDDILLLVVFVAWIAKMAVNKELGLLKFTPLNALMIGYIVVCLIATNIGILTGRINPLRSFFYIIKYIEYFLIYFLFSNNLRNIKQVKNFLKCFLITGFIVCIYGITQIGVLGRTTAPFEGLKSEPNTFGGYLLLLFAVCMGLFLYSPLRKWRLTAGILACLTIPPFIFTLSRSSYFSFIPMYLVLIFLSKKKKLFLIATLMLAFIVGPFLLPQVATTVTKRIKTTFTGDTSYRYLGKGRTLDESAASKVESWKIILGKLKKHPLLGYGVTGVGLVDSQYPRVLGETGIIGFLIFIMLLTRVFKRTLYNFNNINDEWSQGLILGFFAGFIGLLFHSFGANTFIIVRIMGPFWFLTAIVMALPELDAGKVTN